MEMDYKKITENFDKNDWKWVSFEVNGKTWFVTDEGSSISVVNLNNKVVDTELKLFNIDSDTLVSRFANLMRLSDDQREYLREFIDENI